MAVAISQFHCNTPEAAAYPANTQPNRLQSFMECLNPRFFAYGQFPLYLSYAIIQAEHWFNKSLSEPTSFQDAVMALRIISAVSSVLTFLFLIKITEFIFSALEKKYHEHSPLYRSLSTFLIFIFSPVLIQFAHFGTTESLLILYYVVLIYLSIKVLQKRDFLQNYLILSGIVCGLAIATKISSLVYCAIPAYCLLHDSKSIDNFFTRIVFRIVSLARFTTIAMVFGIVLSPYNLIQLQEFYGSLQYESSVALGTVNVFYTRQFFQTTPFLFQFDHIFPYTLGYGVFILFVAGFLFLPWRNRYINLLRISFLLVFIPNGYVYAKWTRFIAPVYPVMLIIAVLFLHDGLHKLKYALMELKDYEASKSDNVILFTIGFIVFLLSIIPGITFLSIYQNPDVRFIASDWIYRNIPQNSYILAETANVVDIPIPSPQELASPSAGLVKPYSYRSFNYYDLDTEPALQSDLSIQLARADYIFVPSRRIFANHTCYEIVDTQIVLQKYMSQQCLTRLQTYPLLNSFYKDFFTGKSGFVKVAEFSSYPRIQLFGKTLIEFPDENAEETWTVFDHPVIRIYKKTSL